MWQVYALSQLEEDEEGGGMSGALMEVGGQGEEQQEMAVVLHEVSGQAGNIPEGHLLMNNSCSQDKKYYPTAEEVYGPEVEVRESVCVSLPACLLAPHTNRHCQLATPP